MALWLHQVVVDAHDAPALARFWAAALDYQVLYEAPDEIVIGSALHAYPGLCFLPVPEDKHVKNRLHLDLAPDDQQAEVDRLLALGARRVDVGQSEEVRWVVLADPEGNEFCVLHPKTSLADSTPNG